MKDTLLEFFDIYTSLSKQAIAVGNIFNDKAAPIESRLKFILLGVNREKSIL